MDYYVSLYFGLFIIVPAIIGLIRLPNINSIFHPFLIIIWVQSCNIIFGGIVIELGYNNIGHYNIWFLLDAYLSLWIFKKWRLFESKKSYRSLWISVSIFWLVETIFFSKLTLEYNSYFRVFYCFIIILMSINTINSLLMRERKALIKNPVFVICCTFVLSNTITVLGESFFASNLELGDTFRISMDHMITITNLFCNLLYALAILWMPKKQAFILQY